MLFDPPLDDPVLISGPIPKLGLSGRMAQRFVPLLLKLGLTIRVTRELIEVGPREGWMRYKCGKCRWRIVRRRAD